MPSRDHRAATVSHASQQGSRLHQITQVFLQTESPPPPAFSVCRYVKLQGKPEAIQELCRKIPPLHDEHIHTSSTAEPKATAEQTLDFCCPHLSEEPIHPFCPLLSRGQGQVPTDRFQAKSSGLLKEMFQSILKIEVTSGKYASLPGRPRRGDTQAMSESSLSSQEVYLVLKQNQNTENRAGYNAYLGSELLAQDLAFV